ncbi:MAG TPA: phosphatase domain-containing protein [Myxococcota bacterium]|nr:phosphatase domain-containing protein [Myxococcota bacterium]
MTTSPKKPAPKRKKKDPPIDMVVVPTDFRVPVPPEYTGDVFVWDLDKTYLRTKFESFGDLVRTIRQTAKDKVAYPGATPLLRALRRGPNGVRPIYFVSASPPQIREKILEKFALDGVEVDGIYFKDNLRNVRPGRFKRLREQMGYKTLALMDLRAKLPPGAVETMFGDDAETDVAIYSTFSEIIEGHIANWPLYELMLKQGVFRDEALRIAWRARKLARRDGVRRIFITVHRDNLEPRYFRRFGNRVTGTRTYFQTAMALHAEDRIAIEDVAVVAEELLGRGGMSKYELSRQLDDLRRRAVLKIDDITRLSAKLTELGVLG